MDDGRTYTAFAGDTLIASGEIGTVLLRTRERMDLADAAPILVFEDRTGTQVDFDLRGTPEAIVGRLASHPHFAAHGETSVSRSGPGRPRLGVVSREVTLLPRHWEWLELQPQGISAALRRLVDEARKREPGTERVRAAREAAGRFMTAMAGNLPGFEEASRALYAGDRGRLAECVREWPPDVRGYLERLLDRAEAPGA